MSCRYKVGDRLLKLKGMRKPRPVITVTGSGIVKGGVEGYMVTSSVMPGQPEYFKEKNALEDSSLYSIMLTKVAVVTSSSAKFKKGDRFEFAGTSKIVFGEVLDVYASTHSGRERYKIQWYYDISFSKRKGLSSSYPVGSIDPKAMGIVSGSTMTAAAAFGGFKQMVEDEKFEWNFTEIKIDRVKSACDCGGHACGYKDDELHGHANWCKLVELAKHITNKDIGGF